jgi:hypothetical protein
MGWEGRGEEPQEKCKEEREEWSRLVWQEC